MKSKTIKAFDDICEELGFSPQFLFELGNNSSAHYRVFDLAKKSGGKRTICVPSDHLKGIQRLILDNLLCRFKMPEHVHGAVKGRSIVTNAEVHVNKPLIVNIDLRDFFGSIPCDRVKVIFSNHFGFDDKASEVFARLTTYAGALPQGAPTSPTLANIAALELDRAILQICEESSGTSLLHYSRYIDDITISGDSQLAIILSRVFRAIQDCGFKSNPEKLKFARANYRQKVTGVIVNRKVNAPKKLIRKLRQQLYYINKFGFSNHCVKLDLSKEEFYREIKGCIAHLRQTRPDLADAFDLSLRESLRAQEEDETNEETKNLYFLRAAIGKEKLTRFIYNNIERRVAPAEILIDEFGLMSLKAFQLTPEQKWLNFELAYIESVEIE